MRLILLATFCFGRTLTFAQAGNFVGTYDVVRITKGKLVDNKLLPPGQVMVMEFHKDGTFLMRDMLIGYEGTWSLSGSKLRIRFVSGPAGKLRKSEIFTLQPSPDRNRIVLLEPKLEAGMLEFRLDPNAIEKWNKRVLDAMKKAQPPAKKSGG